MAPSTIRKAIGAVKDQTSIGLLKVASNMAPELKVAVVKATSHDDDPASEKYIREILHFISCSRGYVSACVSAVSKRLGKTRDWIVAVKCLMLIHRLLNDGDPTFQQEIMYATRRGARLLHLSDFRDEAHSSSWDHSAFVRTYALYLDQRLESMLHDRKQSGSGGEIEKSNRGHNDIYNYRSPPESNRGHDFCDVADYGMRRTRSSGDVRETAQEKKDGTISLREMQLEMIFGKTGRLQRLLDRLLSCRPTGLAKNERMILVALYAVVKESFRLYADMCEVLSVLLDKFFDMEYQDCVKAFDAYATSAKQVDELIGFYNWCKDIGVARSSEYPEVQKISTKLLDNLEEFVRDRAKAMKSPEREVETQPAPPAPDMNEMAALPPPENYIPQPELEPEPPKPAVQETEDLLDLRDEGVSANDQGNKLALALFAGQPADNANGSWEPLPGVTSAWQNPAAETGKADWELALVESASHLSKQRAALGGGLDPLLLNGMYDQGMVRQHVSATQSSGGSASSVALPGPRASKVPVLALPAPDGTVEAVVQDPFAASLSVPPPAYVQMADMEKKQHLLVQEQLVWRQYSRDGMQGEASLAKISTGGYYGPAGLQAVMPYGMQPVDGGGMRPAGFYYTRC